MYAWRAIQNVLDYIEGNLSEDLKTETLAHAAALSPYYFQRLFGRLVKKPVNEYVKLRRLEKAAEELKDEARRILDIALDCGFSDHANFTRAFKDAYGITPEEYRAHPVVLNHFIKPDLLLKYAIVDEDIPFITDDMVVEVTRRKLNEPCIFIGMEGEVPVTELAGGKTTGVSTAGMIWDEFHRQKPNIPQLFPDGKELGVFYHGDAREGCCTYMVGAEASEAEAAEDYVTFTLPDGDYVVCSFEADNFTELIGSAIFKASSFMQNWIKQHNLRCGKFSAEIYYDHNPETSYMELWLPLSPSSQNLPETKEKWNKANGLQKPSMAQLCDYVNNPLLEDLCSHMEAEYQSKPMLEYSRCSMQFGWNVKYKKAGRTLCTLYPMEGYYIALVVIGDRERFETESMLPFFTTYTQQLWLETKTGMGQKWLMIHVTDHMILEDVKQLIAIRRNKKKK